RSWPAPHGEARGGQATWSTGRVRVVHGQATCVGWGDPTLGFPGNPSRESRRLWRCKAFNGDAVRASGGTGGDHLLDLVQPVQVHATVAVVHAEQARSEEHTSELQSRENLVSR